MKSQEKERRYLPYIKPKKCLQSLHRERAFESLRTMFYDRLRKQRCGTDQSCEKGRSFPLNVNFKQINWSKNNKTLQKRIGKTESIDIDENMKNSEKKLYKNKQKHMYILGIVGKPSVIQAFDLQQNDQMKYARGKIKTQQSIPQLTEQHNLTPYPGKKQSFSLRIQKKKMSKEEKCSHRSRLSPWESLKEDTIY